MNIVLLNNNLDEQHIKKIKGGDPRIFKLTDQHCAESSNEQSKERQMCNWQLGPT